MLPSYVAARGIRGAVLTIETSEELIPAREFGWIPRALGERGLLAEVRAVVVARPPTSDFTTKLSSEQRRQKREEQRDTALNVIQEYSPGAVTVVGPRFGHTRPQWIVPMAG